DFIRVTNAAVVREREEGDHSLVGFVWGIDDDAKNKRGVATQEVDLCHGYAKRIGRSAMKLGLAVRRQKLVHVAFPGHPAVGHSVVVQPGVDGDMLEQVQAVGRSVGTLCYATAKYLGLSPSDARNQKCDAPEQCGRFAKRSD